MLKRNKALSLVTTLCLCLALLAPAFVFAPAAQAAGSSYEVTAVPTVVTGPVAQAINTDIIVTVSEVSALRATAGGSTYDTFTVGIPSGCSIPAGQITIPAVPATVDGVPNPFLAATFTGAGASYQSSATTFEVKFFWPGAVGTGKGQFRIHIGNLIVQDVSGDLPVNITPPVSGSGFTGTTGLAIAKVVSSTEGTITQPKSQKTFGDAGGYIDSIIIAESMPGVFAAGNYIDLKVSSGYKWDAAACADGTLIIGGGWGLGNTGNARLVTLKALAGEVYTDKYTASIADPGTDRILRITLDPAYVATDATTASGRIVVGNQDALAVAGVGFPKILVDDYGKTGDVVVSVTSNSTKVTEQDITVATCADSAAKLVEGTVAENLVGGTDAAKIGKFYIEENVFSALPKNKSIIFEIEEGGKWSATPAPTLEKGAALVLGGWSAVGTDGKIIKNTITTDSTTAAKLLFDNYKVNLDPSFSGDLKIKVYGTAGVEGEVKVATVVKPVSVAVTGDPAKVKIGAANQKVADFTITENKKGAILDTATNNVIILDIDDGYKFASVPKVTVSEGDLDLNTVKLINSDTQVKIPIKSSSMAASTITVSEIYVTAYRTAPEGPVNISLRAAWNPTGAGSADGSTALDEGTTAATLFDKSVGSAVVAECVTPAAVEGTEGAAQGQFRIGSNIYEVNGVTKIMDAAPYIKNDRTYVPIRFLGYALGLSDSEIVWDAATQKVTMTKGQNVVELTIGSTTITINGEAKTMDVAPEITSDRTMLPARFVAEGLGATVGWDPATQTILISK